MPPAVPLFIALVLILGQFFHVLFPGRIAYWRRLAVAFVGVALGEFAGSYLITPGPRLGELHPLWDVLFTSVLEVAANRLLRPRKT